MAKDKRPLMPRCIEEKCCIKEGTFCEYHDRHTKWCRDEMADITYKILEDFQRNGTLFGLSMDKIRLAVDIAYMHNPYWDQKDDRPGDPGKRLDYKGIDDAR